MAISLNRSKKVMEEEKWYRARDMGKAVEGDEVEVLSWD